ncbi:hypothetical protein ACVBEG_27140 [Pseudomonas sp. GG8]
MKASKVWPGYDLPGKALHGTAADMAILVRDGKEAQAVRGAVGPWSAQCLSVGQGPGVRRPGSPRRPELASRPAPNRTPPDALRAFACITLNLSLAELQRLESGRIRIEHHVMQFRGYGAVWRHQGAADAETLVARLSMPPGVDEPQPTASAC